MEEHISLDHLQSVYDQLPWSQKIHVLFLVGFLLLGCFVIAHCFLVTRRHCSQWMGPMMLTISGLTSILSASSLYMLHETAQGVLLCWGYSISNTICMLCMLLVCTRSVWKDNVHQHVFKLQIFNLTVKCALLATCLIAVRRLFSQYDVFLTQEHMTGRCGRHCFMDMMLVMCEQYVTPSILLDIAMQYLLIYVPVLVLYWYLSVDTKELTSHDGEHDNEKDLQTIVVSTKDTDNAQTCDQKLGGPTTEEENKALIDSECVVLTEKINKPLNSLKSCNSGFCANCQMMKTFRSLMMTFSAGIILLIRPYMIIRSYADGVTFTEMSIPITIALTFFLECGYYIYCHLIRPLFASN